METADAAPLRVNAAGLALSRLAARSTAVHKPSAPVVNTRQRYLDSPGDSLLGIQLEYPRILALNICSFLYSRFRLDTVRGPVPVERASDGNGHYHP